MSTTYYEAVLVSVQDDVKNILLPLEEVSQGRARTILRRYGAVFEGNFIAWMAGAAVASVSPLARFAAQENMWVELHDNHPGMLRDFLISCKAEPSVEHYKSVEGLVGEVRVSVGHLSAIKNLTLMAYLERASVYFMPYLEKLGEMCGCSHALYTKVHGQVDSMHAEQFIKALNIEAALYPERATMEFKEVLMLGQRLLKAVFQSE